MEEGRNDSSSPSPYIDRIMRMYARRIQLRNYGPIEDLDITLPFVDDRPQPVLLVGENGTGKTIVLSHIVNGLLEAKGITYPETPEVEAGKVYKVRTALYINPGGEYYFGKVDFEDGHFIGELHLRTRREQYVNTPDGLLDEDVKSLWEKVKPHENSRYETSFSTSEERREEVKQFMRQRCILYFPADRFEEPAWLNTLNLTGQAHRTHVLPYEGHTARRVIATSPLRNNQDWLYDIIYDRAAFEIQVADVTLQVDSGNQIAVPAFGGFVGAASNALEQAMQLLSIVMRDEQAAFSLGRRTQRTVSISSQSTTRVPNIFQLSSGESSLLNLGLSILRDSDMSESDSGEASEIRGTVVIDEVDLHLHAVHKHEVLPRLLRMFPLVQFIVTTHSPLFALGMQREFGDDGFGLYRLPEGVQVSAEEFSEFGNAYSAFQQSQAFGQDIRDAVRDAMKPQVFVEGKTDKQYIERAAELLGRSDAIQDLEIVDGGGAQRLQTAWGGLSKIPETMMNKPVLLLFDCDAEKPPADNGAFHKRTIPFLAANPINKGIENLLGEDVLERARATKPAFIDIREEHKSTERGEVKTIPAEWKVNRDEKMNLCNWICENGTADDFAEFEAVLDLVDELMNTEEESD